MLFTALRVLGRCWPAALAWFLAGWTTRALIIRLAAFVGNADELFGLLILPVAILAQLAAFVGMFLVIRRELPHLGQTPDADAAEALTAPVRRGAATLLAAILPFFLLYVAWNLIRDDLVDFYASALTQMDFGSTTTYEVPVGALSISLVIIAFVLRWLLGRFSRVLPRWTNALATYLEAVWVLVALLIVRELLSGVPGWLATRRMFAWAVDGWAAIRDDLAWLGVVGDAVGWTIGQIGTLVALPLAWLAFASIIYFGAVRRSTAADPASLLKLGTRWSRMPTWVRRVGTALAAGILERWRPVALAARLIWRSGPIALGGYLLAFAVIVGGGEWLRLLVYRLLGPHPTGWWFGASDAVEMAVSAIVAVLQVCLVAATFDHALRDDTADKAPDAVSEPDPSISSAGAPEAARPTS